MIDLIAGARPNFMKIAPIIRALSARRIAWRLVHTGQHYDAAMSGAFFEQLGIPEPHVNLEVGSGTHAEQTAGIMVGYERLLRDRAPLPALCLVVGDVNSTMACAIVAQKAGVPVGHVEGGIRSGDLTMPEEVNRIATDAIARWFFTTSQFANDNLRRAGVDDSRIHFVGNTMIDTLLTSEARFRPPAFWEAMGLARGAYLVATLHRPSNVDSPQTLAGLLAVIGAGARGEPVVLPAHPRTTQTLARLQSIPANIHIVPPQPYLEFNFLVKHSRAVVTDSGGVTEEATVMGVPCMTLRDSTERPETVTIGTNELVGTDPRRLGPFLDRIFAGQWKRGGIPDRWDGRAGDRIADAIEQILAAPQAAR